MAPCGEALLTPLRPLGNRGVGGRAQTQLRGSFFGSARIAPPSPPQVTSGPAPLSVLVGSPPATFSSLSPSSARPRKSHCGAPFASKMGQGFRKD